VAYEQTNAFSIVVPHSLSSVIFQSTIAILLLVGFESVTALGAEAKNPKRDIRRAVLLSLTIQGLFAYMFEYFAANFFIGNQLTGTVTDAAGKATKVTGYAAAAVSSAPIGDMMKVIGDTMLGGTGFTLTVILAGTVILALIGTTLACLNTAVRITYVMGRDKEMPNILGLLHGRFATPHWGVLVLAVVSAAFGAYGVLNVDNLTQITLASNTGTFLVYGLTNLIALIAFAGTRDSSFFKHKLIPGLGFLANLAALGGVIYLSITAGGATQTDTVIALGMVVVWALIGVVWFTVNTRRQGRAILVEKEQPIRITTAV
jgi:amino acid transporter